MRSAAKPTVLRAKPYIPGKPIEEVKRELGLKRVVKLASNENPFEPPAKVLEAIQNAARTVNRYPDGGCFLLRKALAERLSVKPDQLIFGNGSDELIVFAARAFLRPGDEAVIAKPSFLIYEMASRLEGAKVHEIPLKDFRYNLDAMQRKINSRTRVVFLGNPDNPSGMYLTHRQVASFLESVPSKTLVFIDEAYHEYVTADDYADSLKLLKSYPNLFVSRTFSKMYGLAGLRVGYGVGSAELVDVLNRVREPFNVNSIAQAAAVACLKDQAYYKKLAAWFEAERRFLCGRLDHMELKYQPSCTNFIQVNVGPKAAQTAATLLKLGVIVRDMTVWGLGSYIRVTIGTRRENLLFIKALAKALNR